MCDRFESIASHMADSRALLRGRSRALDQESSQAILVTSLQMPPAGTCLSNGKSAVGLTNIYGLVTHHYPNSPGRREFRCKPRLLWCEFALIARGRSLVSPSVSYVVSGFSWIVTSP